MENTDNRNLSAEEEESLKELAEILFHLYQQNPNLADELEQQEE